jgi:hypothetical protein
MECNRYLPDAEYTLAKTCSELSKGLFGRLVSAKTALLNDYAYLCGNTRIRWLSPSSLMLETY